MLPANLPSIRNARIPETYSAAKIAIAKCAKVDECQDWADKAEALASYAKQAEDSELRRMADRIQARAIQRCGELLRAMAPKETAGPPIKNNRTGAVTITRKELAEDAGLSLRQKRTALRVSNIPKDEFEGLLESEEPPTVTALAERGKKPAAPASVEHLKGRDPEDFKISTHLQGRLRDFAKFLETADFARGIRGAYDREVPEMAEWAINIQAALGKLLDEIRRSESDGKNASRSKGRS